MLETDIFSHDSLLILIVGTKEKRCGEINLIHSIFVMQKLNNLLNLSEQNNNYLFLGERIFSVKIEKLHYL